jgi:hypothetical protein
MCSPVGTPIRSLIEAGCAHDALVYHHLARAILAPMRDYTLVGCGHCRSGVLVEETPACPFQPHPLCESCLAATTTLLATLRAQGHDPLAKRRSAKRTRTPVGGQPQLL